MKNLETKRYLLRKPKMEDAEEIYEKWRKDFSPEEVIGEVIKYLFTEQPFEVVVTKFYDKLKEDTECLSSILERIGMKKEGILRNRMINSKGQKIDRHVYSILKEEWENY